MKFCPVLSFAAGLSVLANATRVAPADANPQVTHADKTDPSAITTSDYDSACDRAHLDITAPPPGSFGSECSPWQNEQNDCKNLGKRERAKRKLCRYTGCEGKTPSNCANKPRSMVERKAVVNSLPGYWKSFGFGV